MHSIYVKDVLKICGGTIIQGNENLELINFSTDTRQIKERDVYIALKGENFNGNMYYKDAIEKKASCCILEEIDSDIPDTNTTIILVKDTLKCLQQLAAYKRSLYDIEVIAITGSVGKTSTKDIIYNVVSQKYKTHKTEGNYNNHIGVPLTILGLKDHEALVIELGMNHLKEISLLTNIAKPTIAVITNIGTSHIGNLGSRENILKAKLEILEGLTNNKVVLNYDNDLLKKKGQELEKYYDIYSVSIKEKSKYQAENINSNIFETSFNIKEKAKDIKLNIGVETYIYNALMAYAIGDILNIPKDKILKGISSFKSSKGRLEKRITKKGTIIIDDTYNASYDSMTSAIKLLGKTSNKRKIAILGDMLELGDYAISLHEKLGTCIVENKIDILITIGALSKNIETCAINLGFDKNNTYHFNTQEESSTLVETVLEKNDIVLIKGSHSIQLNKLVDKLMLNTSK